MSELRPDGNGTVCRHCGEMPNTRIHTVVNFAGYHQFEPAPAEQPHTDAEAELLGQRIETFYGSENSDKLFPRHDPRCDVYIQKGCSCGLNPKSDGNIEPFGPFTECMHQHPRYMCKMPECQPVAASPEEGPRREIQWPESVPRSEFSIEFVQYMANRMATSFYRYGAIANAYPHKVNALESLKQRIKEYKESGNTEFLVDAANFCLIEFLLPSMTGAEFRATDSGSSPGRISNAGYTTTKSNADLVAAQPVLGAKVEEIAEKQLCALTEFAGWYPTGERRIKTLEILAAILRPYFLVVPAEIAELLAEKESFRLTSQRLGTQLIAKQDELRDAEDARDHLVEAGKQGLETISELRVQLQSARGAIKLILARIRNMIPWQEIAESDVDAYIAEFERIARETKEKPE